MSRTKKLLLLVLVLALLAAAGLYFAGQQKKAEAEKADAEAAAAAEAEAAKTYAFQIDPDEIVGLSWKCLSRGASVRRDGDAWAFTENGAEQIADSGKVEVLLNVLKSLEALKKVEKPEDMSPFGFDDPICKVVVESSSGMYVLTFGDSTKTNADVNYFDCGDGFLYTVDGAAMEKFYLNNADLLSEGQ